MLTVIIPALNEAPSLEQLWSEIDRVGQDLETTLEVIFVDDGSRDDSWEIIQKLSESDQRVRGIRLRRNFGKAAALTAGIQAARGRLIMMADADLQDDPAEIPRFLAKLAEGFDVVNGWKQRRRDPWHKVYPSKVFNWLVGWLNGLKLHDHNCGFKLFRAEVADEIRIYGELHRFIPVLAHARGFRVTEITVNHRERQFGRSKYGVRRFLRGMLDLITVKFLTGFGQRPQHMLGAMGLFFFLIGSIGLGMLGIKWLLMNPLGVLPAEPIGTRPLLAYCVASTLLGAQAMTLGLMAELIVAYTVRAQDTFSIAEHTNNAAAASAECREDGNDTPVSG